MTKCCSLLTRRLLLASLAALALVPPAGAQTWPQKPVRILVPFAAGGNIDLLARLTGQRLSEIFGQQFVIENRVGGNGSIAVSEVARANADGHLLLWAGPAVISIFPAITKAPYDPIKDFAPISVIGTNPQALVINPKIPAKTVADFVGYVKSQKEKLPYAGGGGPGSFSNLFMSLFLKRAGIEMTGVSYRGTAPAMTDIIAGHVPTMFTPLSEALPQAANGNIRILAVSGEKRAAQVPDVPTLAETYPGLAAVSWNGLMAPAATPKGIVERIAAEFARAVKDPKFLDALNKAGVDPLGSSPTEFAAMIAKDVALWAEAVKIAGVTLQQ